MFKKYWQHYVLLVVVVLCRSSGSSGKNAAKEELHRRVEKGRDAGEGIKQNERGSLKRMGCNREK